MEIVIITKPRNQKKIEKNIWYLLIYPLWPLSVIGQRHNYLDTMKWPLVWNIKYRIQMKRCQQHWRRKMKKEKKFLLLSGSNQDFYLKKISTQKTGPKIWLSLLFGRLCHWERKCSGHLDNRMMIIISNFIKFFLHRTNN